MKMSSEKGKGKKVIIFKYIAIYLKKLLLSFNYKIFLYFL